MSRRSRTRGTGLSGPGRFLLALLAVLVLAVYAAHRGAQLSPSPAQGGHGNSSAVALRQLNGLRVIAARTHHPRYQRGCAHGQACSFGQAWTDDTTAPGGDDGCDTRDDVLRAQLVAVRLRPGSRCVVVAGTLHDPYTGHTIAFSKAHASAVQIDHLVPLALAWDLGAWTWPQAKRDDYANDEHLVLLAVDGPANEAKGDFGPAAWMPPNASYRASYAARYVAVLAAYHLPVTAADKTALTAALKGH
jgi:hypothetical protein